MFDDDELMNMMKLHILLRAGDIKELQCSLVFCTSISYDDIVFSSNYKFFVNMCMRLSYVINPYLLTYLLTYFTKQRTKPTSRVEIITATS